MGHLRKVLSLTAEKIKRAAEALGRAFHDDPFMTRLIPDGSRRARLLPRLQKTVVRYGYLYGEVYTTPAVEGVVVWLLPGQTTLTPGRMLRTGMLAAPLWFGVRELAHLQALFTYAGEMRRRYAPGRHWYLLSLRVEPGCQGQGIGSMLLQPALARADADALPCYLDTEKEANVAFYEKHGFKVVGAGEAPHSRLPIWALRRETVR